MESPKVREVVWSIMNGAGLIQMSNIYQNHRTIKTFILFHFNTKVKSPQKSKVCDLMPMQSSRITKVEVSFPLESSPGQGRICCLSILPAFRRGKPPSVNLSACATSPKTWAWAEDAVSPFYPESHNSPWLCLPPLPLQLYIRKRTPGSSCPVIPNCHSQNPLCQAFS